MNYYDKIKNKLIDNEIYSKVKDYSKEKHRVITYYETGKLLSEAGKEYGKDIIGEYAKKLMIEVNKRYNKRTLFRMRQFYNAFKDEKLTTMLTQLSWSHFLLLLPMDNKNKIEYYINQVNNRKLTQRQLQEIIKNKEYERLPESTKNKLVTNTDIKVEDLIKEPILIKNTTNMEAISEKALQKLILEDIESFMKELGNGFTYVRSEYKIKIGNSYNYIDLLLYNIEFNCYVVIELKVTELRKEHIGQIEVYMNYIDEHLKKITQDKTIGMIICKENNKYIMKYCSDKRILSKEYELV